jgi:hypothetical protein
VLSNEYETRVLLHLWEAIIGTYFLVQRSAVVSLVKFTELFPAWSKRYQAQAIHANAAFLGADQPRSRLAQTGVHRESSLANLYSLSADHSPSHLTAIRKLSSLRA